MECRSSKIVGLLHWKYDDHIFWKYESPLIGKRKVFYGGDGQWELAFASAIERVAVISEILIVAAQRDRPKLNLKKGDRFQQHASWIINFGAFTLTRVFSLTQMDGAALLPGEKAYDRMNPGSINILCKKPDETWENREKR